MNGFVKGLLVVGAIGAVLVGLWRHNNPSYSWRQKLTVTVETPQGDRSASAVTAIRWTTNIFSGGWGGAAMHSRVTGEAVVVDLGSGRYVFALLGGEAIANLATQLVTGEGGRQWSRPGASPNHDRLALPVWHVVNSPWVGKSRWLCRWTV